MPAAARPGSGHYCTSVYLCAPDLSSRELCGPLFEECSHALAMSRCLKSLTLQFAFTFERCLQVAINRGIDQLLNKSIGACRASPQSLGPSLRGSIKFGLGQAFSHQ